MRQRNKTKPHPGKGTDQGVRAIHKLAWTLRVVMRGKADRMRLATDQDEQQKVTVFYAQLSGKLAAPDRLVEDQRMLSQGVDLPDLLRYV